MPLIHVKGWLDRRIPVAEFNTLLRVYLQVDSFKYLHIRKGKHLAHNLEDKGAFVKGKLFGYSPLGQTEGSEGFDVQNRNRLATR